MYSPREYVESLVSRLLGEYVEDYDGSDFSFGLWQGDLVLRNLVLKPLTIDIGDGMTSRIIFGSIDSLHIVIPWSQLSSGHISIAVDTINVVVQLSVDQTEDADHRSTETLLHRMKMATLDSEERKLFGVGGGGGWKTRLTEALKTSLLAKLFNGVQAQVNDIRVSFVLPLSAENEVAHVQLHTESISMSRQGIAASADFEQAIGKSIDVRGVTMAIERFKTYGELDPGALLERQPVGLVLNPMYFSSELQLCMSAAGVVDVKVQAKFRNTEVTLNLSQLQLVQEIVVFNSGESMRWTFRHLRPYAPVMTSPHLWWQFAIKAVIRIMRHRDGGDSMGGLGGGSAGGKRESLIAARRRYQKLYKRHLESRLLALRSPEEYAQFLGKVSRGAFSEQQDEALPGASPTAAAPAEEASPLEQKWLRMKGDDEAMDELHTYFSAKDILLYRATVRQKMRKDRVAFSRALYQQLAGEHKPASWFPFLNNMSGVEACGASKDGKPSLPPVLVGKYIVFCFVYNLSFFLYNIL
jgi:hypothetical protein